MVALPEVGLVKVQSMFIVVVLPAPLGPRKPKISPGETLKLMLSTAARSLYFLTRFSTWIILSVIFLYITISGHPLFSRIKWGKMGLRGVLGGTIIISLFPVKNNESKI
jgi:hypothetical protein